MPAGCKVNLRTRPKGWKIWTRKTPNTDTFLRSDCNEYATKNGAWIIDFKTWLELFVIKYIWLAWSHFFLVMWIETDVFIRNFIKWVKISVNIENSTKWIETSVNIRNFTKWIEMSVNNRNFTKWTEIIVKYRLSCLLMIFALWRFAPTTF